MLSLGVTTAGVVTLIAGNGSTAWLGLGALYLGPSTGQWYAGEPGVLGLGLRAAGAAAMIGGLSQILQSENDCEPTIDGDCGAANASSDRARTTGGLLMWTGAGLWVGSTIYDVILARRAAEHANARHALRVAPLTLSAGGHVAHGLAITGRF